MCLGCVCRRRDGVVLLSPPSSRVGPPPPAARPRGALTPLATPKTCGRSTIEKEPRARRSRRARARASRARRSQVPRVRRDDPRGEHLPVHPLRDRHCAGPDGPRRGPFATVDDASEEEEEEDDDDARRSFVRLVCRSRSRRRRRVSRTIRRSLACRSSSTTTTTEPPHPCDGTTISFSSPLRGGVVVRSRVARVVPDRFFGSSRR